VFLCHAPSSRVVRRAGRPPEWRRARPGLLRGHAGHLLLQRRLPALLQGAHHHAVPAGRRLEQPQQGAPLHRWGRVLPGRLVDRDRSGGGGVKVLRARAWRALWRRRRNLPSQHCRGRSHGVWTAVPTEPGVPLVGSWLQRGDGGGLWVRAESVFRVIGSVVYLFIRRCQQGKQFFLDSFGFYKVTIPQQLRCGGTFVDSNNRKGSLTFTRLQLIPHGDERRFAFLFVTVSEIWSDAKIIILFFSSKVVKRCIWIYWTRWVT